MKKVIYSIVGVVLVFFTWAALDTSSFLYKNVKTTARIDLYEKTDNSTPCFEVKDSDSEEVFTTVGWRPDIEYQGYSIHKKGKKLKGQKLNLEIRSKSDNCKINISLLGPWRLKDPNNKEKGLIERWINYTDFTINGKEILEQPTAVWYNKPFHYSLSANNGEVINIGLMWQKYYLPQNYTTKAIIYIICLAILIAGYFAIWRKNILGGGIIGTLLLTTITIFLLERQQIKVDFYGFVILATTYFFIIYKVGKYLARFKLVELRSRIDIVLVCSFFILLFVPMMHISEAEKSEQENRMLATYKPLFQDKKINLNFGKDFDAWFSDRFWGRTDVIKYLGIMAYRFSQHFANEKALYMKESNWMFNIPLVSAPFDNNQTNNIIKNIQLFDKMLADNGIKLYILLVPQKESIYQEKLVPYGYDKTKDESFQKSIAEIIKLVGNNRIIYPYNELIKAKEKDYVFFKQAHHWTDWGAYQGYVSLLNVIRNDFPDIDIISLADYNISKNNLIRDDYQRDFNEGHTTRLLNLLNYANEILTTEYTYYDYKNIKDITEVRKHYIKTFYNPKGKYRIFLTGNSQNEDLLGFLSASTKDLKYTRFNMGQLPESEQFKFMKHYKKDMFDFKPDILVVTLSVDLINKFNDFFKD